MSVCGIDFGTTNSTIGVISNGIPEMIQVEKGKDSIPSVLFFPEGRQVPILGQAAIDTYISGVDGRLIRSIKRILGSDLMNKFTQINGRAFHFKELIALFLRHLKKEAEKKVGRNIETAVIGCPVHFQDDDPQADVSAKQSLSDIAHLIGFKNVFFQYEPIAAAFFHEQTLTSEKLALVVDLGGGTSDFTLIRIGPKHKDKTDRQADILATTGIRIGGNDFDKSINFNFFMPEFGKGSIFGEKSLICPNALFSDLSEWNLINFCYTLKNRRMIQDILLTARDPVKIQRLLDLLEYQEAHRLLQVAEDTKIVLTQQLSTTPVFEGIQYTIPFYVTRALFEDSVRSLIDKIDLCMRACLTQAGVTSDQVDMLILTGGSCQIPLIQKTFRSLFPDAVFSDKNKMLSVGIGLTYAAQRIGAQG